MTQRAVVKRSKTLSVDNQLSEKQIEHLGDKLMQMLGFEIIRFSQPRNTMQTFGIPDRRYYRAPKADHPAYALWWEAKRVGGKQSYYQQNFQAMVEGCGETYLCGTDDVLLWWAREWGLIR